MKISIYRLVNPLDDSTFYIGATKHNLKRRYSQHMGFLKYAEKSSSFMEHRRAYFVLRLIQKGALPYISLIETVDDNVAKEREDFWIRHYSQNGNLIQDVTKAKYSSTRKRKTKF